MKTKGINEQLKAAKTLKAFQAIRIPVQSEASAKTLRKRARIIKHQQKTLCK